jgi:hypothetical protein
MLVRLSADAGDRFEGLAESVEGCGGGVGPIWMLMMR